MTPFLANSLPGKRRLLWLLLAFALTTICLGSVVALVIYADTHNTVESENAVRHTQSVLLTLGNVAQQLDQAELQVRLYRATNDADHLRTAQSATAALENEVQRLARLMWDPLQERRAGELEAATARLSASVNGPAPDTASIREDLTNCQRALSLIEDEERSNLARRAEEAQRDDLLGIVRRTATIGVGAALILVLFGFLLRDALRRERFEQQLAEANEQLHATVMRLEEQAWESKLLMTARDEVALCLEVKEAEGCVVRTLDQLLPGTAGNLYILNVSRQMLESVGAWGTPRGAGVDAFEAEWCCGLRSGRARWRQPEQSQVHCGHFGAAAPERYLCLPLIAHGETLGVVSIECSTVELAAMTEKRESSLTSLGEMAAMAIAGLHLRHKLENRSIRDGMTGLFNRSFMEVALERELHRASRQGREIAVMMLDIDHFKEFNDTFGHEAGDVVLREVAECIRVAVRSEDIVCRFGGEEFVVILPEITDEAALERAELLRRTVGDRGLRYRGQLLRQVTISVGVAMYPQNAETAEDLVRSADLALYAAKNRGRNCVAQAETGFRVEAAG